MKKNVCLGNCLGVENFFQKNVFFVDKNLDSSNSCINTHTHTHTHTHTQ